MINRTYYIVECNDGSPVSDELETLKEARKYIKEVKAEDRELGLEDGDITYYIVRHEIKDNTDYEAIIK